MATIMRVRATLNYGNGGPGLFTAYWFPGTTGGVTADATDAVARVRGFFVGIAGQLPSTSTVLVQSDVALINDTGGALVGQLSATPVAVVTGTGGSNLAPLAAMALVRLRTGTIIDGRLVRGRWYIGPISATALSSAGGISTTAAGAITSAGTSMLTGGATTSALAVWHRPQSGGGGGFAFVTSVSTWTEAAVLRSRRDP